MTRFLLCCASLLVTLAIPAEAKRVALVVGNSSYQHTPRLDNPKHDAADMAAALKRLGFEVVDGFDVDKTAFERRIRDFSAALRGAEVGVFFYAGHGLQVAGQNYLVPVDAKLDTPDALDWEMIRLDLVHRTMERAASTNILFLDACRNNPLTRNLARAMGTRSTQIGHGLAPMELGVGTLISFSTQPGNVALDGTGRNSPFAAALISRISSSTDELSALLIDVRNDVRKATQNVQVPWEHSALTGRFFFTGTGKAASQPPSGQAPAANDGELLALKQQLAKLESELKRQQQTGAGSAKEITALREELTKNRGELQQRQEEHKSQRTIDEIVRKAEAGASEDGLCARSGWPRGDNWEGFKAFLEAAAVGTWKVNTFASGKCELNRVTKVHNEGASRCVSYSLWVCSPGGTCGTGKVVDCLDQNGKLTRR